MIVDPRNRRKGERCWCHLVKFWNYNFSWHTNNTFFNERKI